MGSTQTDELEIKVYINPFTDFGFKRIFGEEENKDILIDFLNEMLKDFKLDIHKLEYKNVELQGERAKDKKIIFDLYCTGKNNEHFIIELQKAKQEYFKDRMIYYTSRLIQSQGKKGKWNYELQPVYFVGIMDFVLDGFLEVKSAAQLLDIETHEIFYQKLGFLSLYVRNFQKTEAELETNFDKWLFLLKNLSDFDEDKIPPTFMNRIFEKVFKIAKYVNMDIQQQRAYQQSLKQYNDLKNTLDTATKDGYLNAEKKYMLLLEKERKEKEEAKKTVLKMIQRLVQKGFSLEEIAEDVGKSVEEIQELLR